MRVTVPPKRAQPLPPHLLSPGLIGSSCKLISLIKASPLLTKLSGLVAHTLLLLLLVCSGPLIIFCDVFMFGATAKVRGLPSASKSVQKFRASSYNSAVSVGDKTYYTPYVTVIV